MYSVKDREKSVGKMRPLRLLAVLLVPVVALILGATAPKVWAWGGGELDEAEIFFEYNSTDQDLGIQFFLDGEGWKRITIFTPDWHRSVTVSVKGKYGQLGLTEIFSERAEPELCPDDEEDCDPTEAIEDFQEDFPEGVYRFYGWTVEGDMLYGTATLMHNLPDAPELLATYPTIQWVGDPDVVGYEVVVEMVAEVGGEEREFVNTATLPATVTSFTISKEFRNLKKVFEKTGELVEFKVEVIAREESGNKTITEEILFELEEEE